MTFTLRAYLFLCLGLIAVAPVLLLGGLQTQRLAELQLAQSDRETSLAADALAREVAQLMLTRGPIKCVCATDYRAGGSGCRRWSRRPFDTVTQETSLAST